MRPLRTKSALLDVFGAFVRDLGGWIAVADLVVLMGRLGVDEPAVRAAVSRFTGRDLLVREARGGRAGYALSEHGRRILREGDVRIYDRLEPASVEDGWAVAAFSVPERDRSERHRLRSRLTWLGFGNLVAGLWIAPRRMLDRAVAMVEDLGLQQHVDLFAARYHAFDDLDRLVERCWDLGELRAAYADYLADFEPLLEAWQADPGPVDPAGAFADYVAALHEWRKLPFLDPGLPAELLPDGWAGHRAAAVFAGLRGTLEPAARTYVASVVSAPSEPADA